MGMAPVILAVSALLAARAGDYIVCVDAGGDEGYFAAGQALADKHSGSVIPFSRGELGQLFERLQGEQPRFVVFVLPPAMIDVDLANDLLERATRLDADLFTDFEYAFLTGRDARAAQAFAERVVAAWETPRGRRGMLFASWEGPILPSGQPLSATRALGLDFEQAYVRVMDEEPKRREQARPALQAMRGKDILFFMSHGYPHEMSGCYRASDLRDWKVDLTPAILFNCACYNGAPGRWFDIGPGGRFVDRGLVSGEDSVALQILDSGVSAYFSGINPWHGWLTAQVLQYVVDEGCRLGEAAKRMWDRLSLEFDPGRIDFPPTAETVMRGEGFENRRRQGAGMILYGDPAWAPYAATEQSRAITETQLDGASWKVRVGFRPLLEGPPGVDYLLPQARLMNYYSVRTQDVMNELSPEIYRRLALPAGISSVPVLRVLTARVGEKDIPTGEVQLVPEETRDGRFLHVRIPLAVCMAGTTWAIDIAQQGIAIELAAELKGPGGE
ncbi:MAG: hypothetical protein AB1486_20835 [Planctomycetota bacterium]